MVPEAGRAEEAQRAAGLKKVPLDGFMSEADWHGVCLEMRTRGGVFWPIPVMLSASDKLARDIDAGALDVFTARQLQDQHLVER